MRNTMHSHCLYASRWPKWKNTQPDTHSHAYFFSFIYVGLCLFFLWNFAWTWIIVHIWVSSKCHWTACPVPDFAISQLLQQFLIYSCICVSLDLPCSVLGRLFWSIHFRHLASLLDFETPFPTPSPVPALFSSGCVIFPHLLIVVIIPYSIMKSVCVYQSFLSFRLVKILLISRACMLTKLFKELEI